MPDINVNNPIFFTPVPQTFQIEENLRHARTTASRRPSGLVAVPSDPKADTPPTQRTAELFKDMTVAVASIGDLLSKGQDATKALNDLAASLGKLAEVLGKPGERKDSPIKTLAVGPALPEAPPGAAIPLQTSVWWPTPTA